MKMCTLVAAALAILLSGCLSNPVKPGTTQGMLHDNLRLLGADAPPPEKIEECKPDLAAMYLGIVRCKQRDTPGTDTSGTNHH